MKPTIMKSVFSYLLGSILSGSLIALGVLLVEPTQSGLPMIISVLSVPILGVSIYNNYKSPVGLGMLGIVPLFILVMLVFMIVNGFF